MRNTTDHKSWTDGGKGSGYKSYRDAYDTFNNPNASLEDGYRAFNYGYVRPTGKESSYNNRIKVVRQVYDRIKNAPAGPNYIHTEQPDATRVARPVIAKPINRYDDGGQIYTPKSWDDLSLSEKSDVMEVAVRHGLRDLNEIRQAYNDFAESPLEVDAGGNTFKNGGYVPSDSIKKRIANWEGSSMKTNRSFEDEARDFNRVIPENIRNSLTQQQLDALSSYGYNVGMGRLKERTLPVLTNLNQPLRLYKESS